MLRLTKTTLCSLRKAKKTRRKLSRLSCLTVLLRLHELVWMRAWLQFFSWRRDSPLGPRKEIDFAAGSTSGCWQLSSNLKSSRS